MLGKGEAALQTNIYVTVGAAAAAAATPAAAAVAAPLPAYVIARATTPTPLRPSRRPCAPRERGVGSSLRACSTPSTVSKPTSAAQTRCTISTSSRVRVRAPRCELRHDASAPERAARRRRAEDGGSHQRGGHSGHAPLRPGHTRMAELGGGHRGGGRGGGGGGSSVRRRGQRHRRQGRDRRWCVSARGGALAMDDAHRGDARHGARHGDARHARNGTRHGAGHLLCVRLRGA